jgi:hypothetical protein
MNNDSCRVGKGAVHMHGLSAGKAQHRAHHGRIGVEQAMMVGTALRRASCDAVQLARAFAHPTAPRQAS